MIFKEIKPELLNNDSPVLIIGSGPAGISIALDLEKKNISSTIIEAGEEFSDELQLQLGAELSRLPQDDLEDLLEAVVLEGDLAHRVDGLEEVVVLLLEDHLINSNVHT